MATERFSLGFIDPRAGVRSDDARPPALTFWEAYTRGWCLSLHRVLPVITDRPGYLLRWMDPGDLK